MENEDLLKRIKLMMNYDSKKTLTENVDFVVEYTEKPNEVTAGKLFRASDTTFGTDENKFLEALRRITTLKDFSDVQNILSSKYNVSSISKLINDEFGKDDHTWIENFKLYLNKIPGVTASYEFLYPNSSGDIWTKGYKENSFVIKTTGQTSPPEKNKSTDNGAQKPKFNWTTAPTIEEAKNGKYIKHGMSGDSVVEIQTKLNEKGGYNLETKTKKFGTNTKNALIDFQKKNNITPSKGVFGPLTWRVLFTSPNANIEKLPQTRQEEPKITGTIQNVSGVMDTEKELEKERQSGTYLPQGEEGPINQPDYSRKQGQLTNQNPGTISQKKLNRR